ncbi:hypothetical protein GW7_04521 [Heterocephalus glaber]|uniref:Uncharacterized protein n=1 Tax=Heterocephalus glaber TaxID=10181 RepID=G5BGH6_HETGA|nr:hypothetical protein GW7_04521 [Heterocephalus glaber]
MSKTSSSVDLKEDWSIAIPVKEVKLEEERNEKYPELKKEMETLLSKAIHLIKSLETDRAEAEQMLRQQKSRKKMIIMKIDSWSIWKLQELPLAVQKAKLNNLHTHYCSEIDDVKVNIEESEEAAMVVLKETKSTTDEVSTLSRTKKTWDVELYNVSRDFSDISIVYAQAVAENKRLANEIITITDQISERANAGPEGTKTTEHEQESKVLKGKRKDEKHSMMSKEERLKGGEEIGGKEESRYIYVQKKLYSIQEAQILERESLLKNKALYALALAEILEPLQQLEDDAVRIRTVRQEQADTLSNVLQKEKYVKAKVEKTKHKLRRKGRKTRDTLTKTEEESSNLMQHILDFFQTLTDGLRENNG